jgi:hypothetical protein
LHASTRKLENRGEKCKSLTKTYKQIRQNMRIAKKKEKAE